MIDNESPISEEILEMETLDISAEEGQCGIGAVESIFQSPTGNGTVNQKETNITSSLVNNDVRD